jgi:hypothetical protein
MPAQSLPDLCSLGDDLWGHFTGGKEGMLWYYRTLVETYSAAHASPMVEELDRVAREIEDLAANEALKRLAP